MGSGKPSRKRTSKSKSSKKYRKAKVSKIAIVPGYTRIGGAYGRALPCGPEKKFMDIEIPGVNMLGCSATGGTWTSAATPTSGASNATGAVFTNVLQGVTDVTRVGNQICVHNFNFKGAVVLNGVAANQAIRVRYMFVWDMQTNGAVYTAANLLSPTTTNALAISWFRELDEVARFRVIKDKTVTLNASTNDSGTLTQHEIPIKCSWKGSQVVHYSSSAAAITAVRSAGLSLLIFSDGADTATSYNGVGRIKFTDV